MAKGQQQHTPDLELVVALAVLGVIGASLVGAFFARLSQPAMRVDLGHLVAAALGVALWCLVALTVAGLGLLAVRTVCTWRTLRTRVAYAVLPPANFEPRPEAIEIFGQQPGGRALQAVQEPRRLRAGPRVPRGRVAQTLVGEGAPWLS